MPFSTLTAALTPEEDEIQRRIRYSHTEFRPCQFATDRTGMVNFSRLVPLLRNIDEARLATCLDAVDDVRASHHPCPHCCAKILAFCEIFTADRLSARHASYRREYEKLVRNFGNPQRNYRAEVHAATQTWQ